MFYKLINETGSDVKTSNKPDQFVHYALYHSRCDTSKYVVTWGCGKGLWSTRL